MRPVARTHPLRGLAFVPNRGRNGRRDPCRRGKRVSAGLSRYRIHGFGQPESSTHLESASATGELGVPVRRAAAEAKVRSCSTRVAEVAL